MKNGSRSLSDLGFTVWRSLLISAIIMNSFNKLCVNFVPPGLPQTWKRCEECGTMVDSDQMDQQVEPGSERACSDEKMRCLWSVSIYKGLGSFGHTPPGSCFFY